MWPVALITIARFSSLVLGLSISGTIGLCNGYNCDQEDETNLTMVLDVISMVCGGF